MGLTMKEKRVITKEVAERYRKVSKREKGMILDEFIQLTGYNRAYASHVLHNHGRAVRSVPGVVMILDATKKAVRQREKIYDRKVHEALRKIWAIMDYICGKRLAPVLKEVVIRLERHKEIALDEETRGKLFKISAASIDRLLAPDRKKLTLKGKSHTKPGTLLKHQVPIRTFADWDDKRPGFVEIDLVGHDGGSTSGDYLQTLDVTDVSTGWTEIQAVRNKAQVWVFEALKEIRKHLPFELLGIDSDNGSEFINSHLIRYCRENSLTFTRSRSNRKNDNCFVEQKNYSVVRRAVGYMRYTTEQEQTIINELYGHLRLYTNFFQPVMKLIDKIRIGSRVTKKYDQAKTPYHRVLESPFVALEDKNCLRKQYARLNPAKLKREITRLQEKLRNLAARKSLSLQDMEWNEEIEQRANSEADPRLLDAPALTIS
jgi:hypothetical protein